MTPYYPTWMRMQIVLETGEIGRQANGAIMAAMGETVRRADRRCCQSNPFPFDPVR